MNRIQLVASAAPGASASPMMINPDGTLSPFSISADRPLVVTDISIQRVSVVAGPDLFGVDVVQNLPTQTTARWSFVGSISQNVERTFHTGIVFSFSLTVENLASSADSVVVRLWGFTE